MDTSLPPKYYVGVDVGTASARAAVIDQHGTILAAVSHPIRIHSPPTCPTFFEQSSTDIWHQCCLAVKQAVAQANIDPLHVVSLGFDATCSLVALDHTFAPVSLSPASASLASSSSSSDTPSDPCWNIVMWMDHRALAETRRINATGHPVLQLTGGKLSVEMQVPKLLWLQAHLPAAFAATHHWFDLPDFLTWRATGKLDRSICSLVCKWTYVPQQSAKWLDEHRERSPGFQADFFDTIGLHVPDMHNRLLGGTPVRQVGEPVGTLTPEAAHALGLHPNVVVGVSMIDAHAGAVATLAHPEGRVTDNLALISGTSACHIALNKYPEMVRGIWGPYEGVVLPGMYAMEAGQSACGKLIDHLVQTHPAYPTALANANAANQHIYAYLNAHLTHLTHARKCPSMDHLAAHVHVYPDFHGNRSPLADPTYRGTLHGLTLDTSLDALAILYLATVHALALQTRDIVETANCQGRDNQFGGYNVQRVCLSGGLVHNTVFVRVLADVLDMPVVLPQYPEASVVLGAAVVGAAAAAPDQPIGDGEAKHPVAAPFARLWDTMKTLTRPGDEVVPTTDPKVRRLLDAKYQVYEQLKSMQVNVRLLMSRALADLAGSDV